MKIDYTKAATPKEYVCAKCHGDKCKLWREYQTFNPQLLCVLCAARDQTITIGKMTEAGRYAGKYGFTDQIGWYVPAIPDEEGAGYWGYTSVPEAGIKWWRALPNLPEEQ